MTRRALVHAAREVAAHLRGELDPPLREYRVMVPKVLEVSS